MASTAVDPITTEIVRSAFKAAADEMNATLIRSAYTPVIYEMKDCSVALLDEHGDVLGRRSGRPAGDSENRIPPSRRPPKSPRWQAAVSRSAGTGFVIPLAFGYTRPP